MAALRKQSVLALRLAFHPRVRSITNSPSCIHFPFPQRDVFLRSRFATRAATDGPKKTKNDGGGDGDGELQDLLADMVKLQTGRTEVNQFVDEKAAQLSDLAKGAGEDLEKIAEGASLSMDVANARILEQVDSQMTELEAELAAARLEQARRDQEFEEFEKRLVAKQNEGLFFKSLYQLKKKPSPTKEEVLRENPELANSVKQAAKSPMRRNVYGVLAFLAVLTLAKAINDQASIGSILACAAVCVALVFQVVYELSLSDS